jgi:DUF438 domain-containing protein
MIKTAPRVVVLLGFAATVLAGCQAGDTPPPAPRTVLVQAAASAPQTGSVYTGEIRARNDVDLPEELSYVGIQDGVDYFNDSDLEWYLNERGPDTETIVGFAG